jgi:hypothetical protein
MMRSTDGINFRVIAGPLTAGDRDPSLLLWNGNYWMAATQIASGHSFDVWHASDPSGNWTHLVVDVSGIGDVHYAWAPEWFLDPSQATGLGQVHILFAATTRGIDGPFRVYETHPVNQNMTSWSSPVEVTGDGLPSDQIDPFMVYAPNVGTPGKPYKLWYKENDGAFIEYMESASLISGYATVERGDWARWKDGGSIEAICLVQLDGGGWRAYFNENVGLTTTGNFYSDSLDNWTSWSARASIGTEHLMSHGTYIRVASSSEGSDPRLP